MPADPVSFNKDESTPGYAWLHVLNALLLVGTWALTIWLYRQLPERVPGHIGISGVTRWETRESGTWFIMPILATVQLLIMYALSTAAAASPGTFNTPQKKRLLALPRAGQQYAMQPLRAFMYGMGSWLLLLTLWIQVSFYRVAVTSQTAAVDPRGMIAGIIVLTLVPILMTVWLSRSIARRIEEWESRQQT